MISGVVLAAAAAFGAGTFGRLNVGGFWAPNAEATRADAALDQRFPLGPLNLALLVHTPQGVDDPAARAAGVALTHRLSREPGLSRAVSYWTSGLPELRSADGKTALIATRIRGDEDQRKAALIRVYRNYHGRHDGLTVEFGGQPAAEREATSRMEQDLRKTEIIATPIVLVILLIVFGSVVASLLPLAIGLTGIVGTLFVLRVLLSVTHVNLYSLNIATAFSLGLAVDYGLFMVTRYREELHAGMPVPVAVVRTARTAGRTVLFSALTVALSLSSLLLFPLYVLRSLALAGIAVVGLAAVSAVVIMPALLAVIGDRIDMWNVRAGLRRTYARLGGRRRASASRPPDVSGEGRWHTFAMFVMRHPVPLASFVIALLLLVGSPFLHARYALPDETSLPRNSESARVVRALRADFRSLSTDSIYLVSPARRLSIVELASYSEQVSRVPGIEVAQSAAGNFRAGQLANPPGFAERRFQSPDASWLDLSLNTYPQGTTAVAAVPAIRRIVHPGGLLVGGVTAHLVDTKHTIAHTLRPALLVIACSTALLLLLFTGSVLIPIKAILLNLLSLTATFGAMVWIFQEGHLRWLIGDFQVSGAIEMTTPIVMFCAAFGLSMDYELFLLSRIKEEYEAHGDNRLAVARGLEKTGRVVTYAALLFGVVLLSFAISPLGVVKLIGIGLALAILMDATLIRAVLVPAIMRLAGPVNWWAPPALARLHRRLGLGEGGAEEPAMEPFEPVPALQVINRSPAARLRQ